MNQTTTKFTTSIMVLIAIILPKITFGQIGPTNANLYNWQIDFVVFCASGGNEVENEYKLRAALIPDIDNLPPTFNVPDINAVDDALCVEVDGPTTQTCSTLDYKNMVLVTALPFQYDVVANIYEKDGIIPCQNLFDDDLALFNKRITVDTTKVGPEGTNHTYESNGQEVTFQSRWRYFAGEHFNPLSFGSLNLGSSYDHLNSNLFAPIVSDGTEGVQSSLIIYPDQDVYYSFELSELTTVEMTTDDPMTTHLDTKLTLYDNNDNELDNNDDIEIGNNLNSRLVKVLQAGTYKIKVGSVGAGIGGGVFKLKIRTGQLNDLCEGAINLHPNNANCGSNIYSSAEGQIFESTTCAGLHADDDVWFVFIPTANNMMIEVAGQSFADMAFEVYHAGSVGSGCPGQLLSPPCIDEQGSLAEVFSSESFIIGDVYYIRVWKLDVGGAFFSVCLTDVDDDCNSSSNLANCNDAIAFPEITWGVLGVSVDYEPSCINVANSIDGAPTCLPSYTGGDRWFSFTAPESGSMALSIANTDFDSPDMPIGIETFDNCNNSVDICTVILTGKQDTFHLIAGTDNLMRVTLGFAAAGNFQLTLREICPIHVDIDGTQLPLPKVVASDTISSSKFFGYEESYNAGEAIILNPGFEIPNQKTFEIKTDGCSVGG